MKPFIAYCGLDCERCDARLATLRNDDELRVKTAKLWSEWNNVEIPSEAINCLGCRVDGVKTPFCDSLCEIRQCAAKRGVETCGDCSDAPTCEILGAIVDRCAEAAENLGVRRRKPDSPRGE